MIGPRLSLCRYCRFSVALTQTTVAQILSINNNFLKQFLSSLPAQVEPSFLLGFLDSSIESLKLSKENEINGIIARLELIERLDAKKTQIAFSAKALENDSDNINRHENRYIANGSVKSKDILNYNNQKAKQDNQYASKNESFNSNSSTPTQMPPQLLNESPSMNSMLDMPETPTIISSPASNVTSAAHDNSITSDRSETTNTTSDDATVISKAEADIDDDNDEDSQQEQRVGNSGGSSGGGCVANMPQSMTTSITVATSTTLDGNVNAVHANKKLHMVSQNQVYQIIDSLRQTTRLSHEMSCIALRVVLSELETIFSEDILEFLEPIADHLTEPLSAPDDFIEHSHDAQRLRIIFAQLADCKNDSEQRTWMLYEDEDEITRFLVELVEILVRKRWIFFCVWTRADMFY